MDSTYPSFSNTSSNLGITAYTMFNEGVSSSDSQLISELVNHVLHLIFLSSCEGPSSVEEVEELFHVFHLVDSAM